MSMGFPKQEYWSGLPFPSPGDLPDPGIEPRSPAWAGGFFTTEPPGKPQEWYTRMLMYRIHPLIALKTVQNQTLNGSRESITF